MVALRCLWTRYGFREVTTAQKRCGKVPEADVLFLSDQQYVEADQAAMVEIERKEESLS